MKERHYLQEAVELWSFLMSNSEDANEKIKNIINGQNHTLSQTVPLYFYTETVWDGSLSVTVMGIKQ